MSTSTVRPAILAGRWYPADPAALRKEVDGYLASAGRVHQTREVVGLIAPHAGHRFSGPVAGYAYAAVTGRQYDTVAVLSPFHAGHPAPTLTTVFRQYATPLGQVPVDTDTLTRLGAHMTEDGLPPPLPMDHESEHAIEIQLPFLQCALDGEFKLLPLMLASITYPCAQALGRALARCLDGQNALLVASTDLSHFYPEAAANKMDRMLLEAVASGSVEAVIETHRCGQAQACGIMAIVAVMTAVRQLGASETAILHYATSGAVTGDLEQVVGYPAGAFLKPNRNQETS
jgi:AmmeMemoRadiSam system protein B